MSDNKKKEGSSAIEPSKRDSVQVDNQGIKEASSADVRAAEALKSILNSLQTGSPIPSEFMQVSIPPEELLLKILINMRLLGLIKFGGASGAPGKCIMPVSVAFPHCSDVLLAHVKMFDNSSGTPTLTPDDITNHFDDYFEFCDHTILVYQKPRLKNLLDNTLLECTRNWFPDTTHTTINKQKQGIQKQLQTGTITVAASSDLCTPLDPDEPPYWPPPWCLPPSCVTLSGARHLYKLPSIPALRGIKRLFIGDLVWLYHFDMMGIFQILGVILDDFATTGKIPISNGVVDSDIRDDIIALVIEAMIRETKTGLSSSVRERDGSYRKNLGWTTDVGRKLGLNTNVNYAFNTLFHRFIQLALEFYADKRLAVAIQSTTTPTKISAATLITISDTLNLLKKAFDPFDYGRNYSNTLNGIVWVIAGMALIRELRTSLGIPKEYEQPYEYIPAAYDLLVMKRAITPSQTNRYIVHRQCANDARDILLDLEVIDHTDTNPKGELEIWLNLIENRVEGYRTAWRNLTGGVDLGSKETPLIPQKV